MKFIYCTALLFLSFSDLIAQVELSPSSDSTNKTTLNISFNADFYYRNGSNKAGSFSAPSYQHNKLGLGWLNPKFELEHKDMLVVADLAYGEKQASFYAFIDTVWHSYVKELYFEYTFADRLHAALGAYTTHFNFEYSEPGLNKIYSPSFIYTYIPATYSGLRLTYDITDKWSAMAGIYNDQGLDRFHFGKINNLAANVMYESDYQNIAFNFIRGEDFFANEVMSFEIYGDKYLTKKFNLGIDLQHYQGKAIGTTDLASWNAVALYSAYDLTEKWQLGSRVELFSDHKGFAFGVEDNALTNITVCAKYLMPKIHSQILAEYRHDTSTQAFYENADLANPLAKNVNQFTLAAIYSLWE
jgi:hypothetical protein